MKTSSPITSARETPSRRPAAAALLATALAPSLALAVPTPGVATDPFDVQQGGVVVSSNLQYHPQNVICTTCFSPFEAIVPAFAFDQTLGFRSDARIETADLVELQGFRLIAAHDGQSGSVAPRRSMNRFQLTADVDGNGSYETIVHDQTVNPIYEQEPTNEAEAFPGGLVITVMLAEPVIASDWQLSVWQGNSQASFSGVRIIELDAIGSFFDPGCTYSLEDWWYRWPFPIDGFMVSDAEMTNNEAYGIIAAEDSGGNDVVELVRQMIVAELNIADGADDRDIADVLADAYSFMEYKWPPIFELTAEEHAEAVALSEDLTAFNEGEIGPGACEPE